MKLKAKDKKVENKKNEFENSRYKVSQAIHTVQIALAKILSFLPLF